MWSNTIGAKSYKLYRASTTSFTDPVLVATTTDTVYIDSVFTDSKQYYKVKSINPAGESVLSSYASGIRLPSIAPMAVSNFNVYSYTTVLSLSWSISAASTYYDGFKIYRSTSPAGTYVLLDSTTSTSYYDYASESFPTYYYYYVTAYNARGESTPSSKISGSRQ
jgi:fibronectin type 3 domain-containing protein